jgi:hypothetical protein
MARPRAGTGVMANPLTFLNVPVWEMNPPYSPPTQIADSITFTLRRHDAGYKILITMNGGGRSTDGLQTFGHNIEFENAHEQLPTMQTLEVFRDLLTMANDPDTYRPLMAENWIPNPDQGRDRPTFFLYGHNFRFKMQCVQSPTRSSALRSARHQ